MVAHEILQTEKNYIKSLETLNEVLNPVHAWYRYMMMHLDDIFKHYDCHSDACD